MAKRIKSFPPDTATHSRYPWHEWTDGSIWEVTAGEDFEAQPRSLRAVLYQKAKRDGKNVRVAVRGDTVTFQFTSP